MTEQRQALINRFQKWLDTNPRKQIIAAECANIAEKYAEEQLKLHCVSQQRELLNALADKFNESTHTYVGQPMIEETLKAFNCC